MEDVDTLRSPLPDFPIVLRWPVSWGDMDAFQHVNNTVYFRYFESARIAYFTRAAVTPSSTGMPSGVGPILASTSCRFRAPVTYPDTLHLGARVASIGVDRFEMIYQVWSEALNRLAAEGTGLVVAYDYSEKKKAAVPDAWREGIARLEGRAL